MVDNSKSYIREYRGVIEMSKVLIVGAKNTIGSLVRKNLLAQTENHLNLLDTTKIEDYDKVREASFSGDLANDDVLDEAISGQDIVLVDVDSELPQISKAIVKSMKKIMFLGLFLCRPWGYTMKLIPMVLKMIFLVNYYHTVLQQI
jgi:Saccharopine dehydrogenase and related proteins